MSNRHLLPALTSVLLVPQISFATSARPNILFVISDDQSYPHASVYGSPVAQTPAFDFVARNGWLFNNAFVTSPGSSPSRASILTGLYPWQIAEAGTHASSFPAEYKCFPDLLAEVGYHIGFTGKGWGPGNWKISGRKYNPAGPEYNEIRIHPPYKGISNIDYSQNFKQFLDARKEGQPFYFWLGPREPHRPFEKNSWKKADKKIADADIPPFLPDKEAIRGDLLDYGTEIEWYDSQLSYIIEILKEKGELDNTLIIVMSDNGMPFPSAKANCFEYGIHVPLAICWTGEIQKGEVSNELVSGIDLAPTLLDAAGIRNKGEMKGISLLPYLKKQKKNTGRAMAFAGRERHSSARYNNWGYPIRALRTKDFLYIRNFRPERWPAGDPCALDKEGKPAPMHSAYFDIDQSPTWDFIVSNRNNWEIYPYFLKAAGKRPYEELYNIVSDPGCLHNLIGNSKYTEKLDSFRKGMDNLLKKTKDTRYMDSPDQDDIWETYPRLSGAIRPFPENFIIAFYLSWSHHAQIIYYQSTTYRMRDTFRRGISHCFSCQNACFSGISHCFFSYLSFFLPLSLIDIYESIAPIY